MAVQLGNPQIVVVARLDTVGVDILELAVERRAGVDRSQAHPVQVFTDRKPAFNLSTNHIGETEIEAFAGQLCGTAHKSGSIEAQLGRRLQLDVDLGRL